MHTTTHILYDRLSRHQPYALPESTFVLNIVITTCNGSELNRSNTNRDLSLLEKLYHVPSLHDALSLSPSQRFYLLTKCSLKKLQIETKEGVPFSGTLVSASEFDARVQKYSSLSITLICVSKCQQSTCKNYIPTNLFAGPSSPSSDG